MIVAPNRIVAALVIVFAAMVALPSLAATPSHPPHRVSLQLKWRHQFQFAGYYAAIDKGYYAAEGLKVELAVGSVGSNAAQSVVNRKTDFAIGSPSVLLERNRGLPVAAVAAVFQHSPLALMVRRDSDFQSPQSLGGRRVMLGGRDGTDDSEILAMFAAEGMTRQPILLPHSGNFDDLFEGRVDAISSYLTDTELKHNPVETELFLPRHYGIDFYGDVLVTSLALATAQPETVRAFMRASLRGWDYALRHPEEIADLIHARYAPDKSRESLVAEAAAMRELILPDLVEIGHMNRGRWTHIGKTYAMLGLMGPDWTLDNFLFSEIETEQTARTSRWIKIGGIVGLGGLLVALLLAGFVARLRSLVRRRTRELTASEEQFRAIFDNINDAIFLLAPGDGTILSVNQRVCDLFGYPREELLRLSIGDLGFEGGRNGRTDLGHWPTKAPNDRPHLFEWRVRAKTGRDFWVEVSLCQARIGDAERLLVVAREISARKEVEEKLRRTIDDLVSSNSDLERFAYVSSHDLQTPLRNVVSYAQLLERRYRGRLDADADEFIGFIVDNTRHMSELINDLLDYTRVGRPSLPLVEVDVRRPIEHALALLQPEIAALEATITIGEMPRVMADEAQMVSLMQNLIGNSLKYRHPDRPPVIQVEATPYPGAMWCIAVHDNGIGIERQYFAKIFEIFQRLHPDHKSSGTGIGLALCQRIVHRFGGDIWVESAPGIGTTLLFTLVAAPER